MTIVVFTPARAAATWAARPIEVDGCGAVVATVVLGPDRIPPLSGPAQAAASPHRAVLSALTHPPGRGGAEVLAAALAAAACLDPARAAFDHGLAWSRVDEAARIALGALGSTASSTRPPRTRCSPTAEPPSRRHGRRPRVAPGITDLAADLGGWPTFAVTLATLAAACAGEPQGEGPGEGARRDVSLIDAAPQGDSSNGSGWQEDTLSRWPDDSGSAGVGAGSLPDLRGPRGDVPASPVGASDPADEPPSPEVSGEPAGVPAPPVDAGEPADAPPQPVGAGEPTDASDAQEGVVCVPSCDGEGRGDDACGGPCGTCGDGVLACDAEGTALLAARAPSGVSVPASVRRRIELK
ncbi:MAG: hypothetical protein AMXMBFR64_26450 [Myxococcales bacterium]